MACFIVPGSEAVVTTVVEKTVGKKHANLAAKLKMLNGFLWGGTALLAFEHLWHGEIQPFFPFLTAASDSAAMAEVFHEMSTVGVTMAAVVTIAWGGITLLMNHYEKMDAKSAEEA